MAEETRLAEEAVEPPKWVTDYESVIATLERAGRSLANAAEPEIDLGPGARALSRSLASVLSAVDLRGSRLDETRAAGGALQEALDALAPAAEADALVAKARQLMESARHELTEIEAHFARLGDEPRAPARLMKASSTAPSLHQVARASLAPRIAVPEPIAPPPEALPPLERPSKASELGEVMAQVRARAAHRAALRELDEESAEPNDEDEMELPEGFAPPVTPALSAYDFARARLRECFEEVAMLGTQRVPQLGDAWRSIEFLDKRLLANLDAVASLGAAALHGIEELVVDSPVKDPSRGFSAVFLLGCMEGRDALATAERIIRHLGPNDPEVWTHAAHALTLVPHPHLAAAMRTLLGDYDPALRSLAVEVLVRREMVSISELATLVRDDDPAVVAAALPALALAAPRHTDLATRLVEAEATEGLERAGWLGMALSAHPRAPSAPERALDDESLRADAARAVALVCDQSSSERLARRFEQAPDASLLEALGWCGEARRAVPLLIEALGSDDDDLVVAAAVALDRICAAELYEEAEIDPEEVMIPEPPTPDVGDLDPPKPLAEQVSDPRDKPSPGSPDTILRPATSPDRWSRWWRSNERRFEEGARYRRGRGYTPGISLWELDGWMLTLPDREHLGRELVVRTGRWVGFSPLGFVAQQEASLKRWQAVVEQTSSAAGSWSRPSRRS